MHRSIQRNTICCPINITSSLDPIEFAGQIARKKAKVIVVGAIPTGFSRKNYYQKEKRKKKDNAKFTDWKRKNDRKKILRCGEN